VSPRLPFVAALAAGLATAALVTLSGCAVIDAANEHAESSYTVDGAVTALVVRKPAGRTEVVRGSGPVSVREQYTYASKKPQTSHRLEQRTLNLVNDGCDQTGFNRRCQVDYRIEVPAGTAVKIDADAGTVVVTDITGALTVTSAAGTVRGTGLAGATKVDSDAGSVDLTYAEAPPSVDITSDAGRVTVRLPEGRYAVDAQVSAGHRSVEVPTDPTSPHTITVRSSAGSVEILADRG
jgi:hypothetical protein